MRNVKDIVSRLSSRLRSKARDLRARRINGSAIVEFAMLAPILFMFLFGIIETGVIFFAQSTLQNATDDAARQIRTGQLQGAITATQLRTLICGEMKGLIPSASCTAGLQIDMRVSNTFTAASYPPVLNANGSLNAGATTIQSSDSCQVVLFRAFYVWNIMTPLMGPLLENMPGDKYLLSAAEAFRNEPFNDPNVPTPSC
ncbi:MAG TPA: TadE/TadG family type IV pilus assembly protein [Rhizomicrobium sp.]|jgi:Flp pilus assembly protein TadG|nr:TadE/TadG family type IV pilus assembly protein [Rhizomicrobium sp.]